MPNFSKVVLFAVIGLILFAVLAYFVKAALFGGAVYAWLATGLAFYCLSVPAAKWPALVRLHAGWTGGHVALHAGFAAVLFVAGARITALAYALVVGWWLFRSGHLRPGGAVRFFFSEGGVARRRTEARFSLRDPVPLRAPPWRRTPSESRFRASPWRPCSKP